ncbi:MAG TPA: M14 family metallocarboxypeptidase [Opitutaceae bacterium]
MPPVKAAPLDPVALAARFAAAGAKAGFRQERFGAADGGPMIALTRRAPGIRPRIYLSAGIHGDEPAPPLALLSLLDAGAFGGQATWFLCPLLNPDGFVRGTRENAAGVDLNRDYRHLESPEIRAHAAWLNRQPGFDLAVCVHEDWESVGFYLYELNPDERPSAAPAMIEAASRVCPIDMSPVIEGRDAQGGIIRPQLDPAAREKWPESIYLQVNHTRLSYTIETPSSLAIGVRVEALAAAVRAAVGVVLGRPL